MSPYVRQYTRACILTRKETARISKKLRRVITCSVGGNEVERLRRVGTE